MEDVKEFLAKAEQSQKELIKEYLPWFVERLEGKEINTDVMSKIMKERINKVD